ncbi:hypothetical protein [Pyrolobus fumarii]|uniref:hypothetical protein n=1 Tax=Pyrolobus fumarii TaxID=54252 RepID=UPI0014329CFE|nr:hypothetical protein [Pyrolobus fumarii]
MSKCPEPVQLTHNVTLGDACGPVARRAAVHDKVLIVGEEYEAEPRAELYRRLGVDVVVYPLGAGKAPTLVSLLRLLSDLLPSPHEKLLIEGFGGEGVVAAALLMIVDGVSAREAASRVLSLGHGLTTPLESRLLYILEKVLETSPGGARQLFEVVKRGYERGFTHGDAHASSVAELAVEVNDALSRLGYFTGLTPYTLFQSALLEPDEPRDPVHAIASALDSTLVGAVKTVAFIREGNKLEVLVGCETLMHREQCWPEVEAARQRIEAIAKKAGFRSVTYIMAPPEEVACILYRDVDRGLCEE